MRRKTSPNPIVRGDASRALAPAVRSTALPTAAAIALALAAWGCSAPMEDGLRPDPISIKQAPPVPAPSTKAATNPIPPDPVSVDGEAPMVKPTPVTSATVKKPFIGGPRPPETKHKLAGKPAVVHPSI
jgi:hypothetical protein